MSLSAALPYDLTSTGVMEPSPKNLFKERTIHAGQTPPVPIFKLLRALSAINMPMKLSLMLVGDR